MESSIIVLHDVNSEDIEAILSYIYRGQCLVTKQQIPRLVHLSRALKIQGLCNMKVRHREIQLHLKFLENNLRFKIVMKIQLKIFWNRILQTMNVKLEIPRITMLLL